MCGSVCVVMFGIVVCVHVCRICGSVCVVRFGMVVVCTCMKDVWVSVCSEVLNGGVCTCMKDVWVSVCSEV